mmetsp:Transcript_27398/g.81643  ORF Transcript_27398/g.81643 Transcript_27398/m.81643 type:complete len:267 (+) Transcript_27398:91-891(+)
MRCAKRLKAAVPAWVELASELDSRVSARPQPKLEAADAPAVRDVLAALGRDGARQLWTQTAEGLRAAPAECNLVAHFFVARLYDGASVQVRAHLITRPSEDVAHSHGASFFSYCLAGRYRHELWRKVPGPGEACYYETVRATSSTQGSLFDESVRRPGRFELDEERTHEHEQRDLYFMDAGDVFHKVCVLQEHMSKGPVVTLVVRGKRATFQGSHFVTSGAPLAEDVRSHSLGALRDPAEEEAWLGEIEGQLHEAHGPPGRFRTFE